ncbi:MAG: hypothetical protein D8M28_00690 [Proteobacteria bacterium]|nr:hypothetical protein [Pseudomonadota bacterium]
MSRIEEKDKSNTAAFREKYRLKHIIGIGIGVLLFILSFFSGHWFKSGPLEIIGFLLFCAMLFLFVFYYGLGLIALAIYTLFYLGHLNPDSSQKVTIGLMLFLFAAALAYVGFKGVLKEIRTYNDDIGRNKLGKSEMAARIVIVIGLCASFLNVFTRHSSNSSGSARVQATVSQLKAIEAAVTTFRDRYDAIPGDMVEIEKLPGCQNGGCIAGNGDGIIGPGDKPITGMDDERRLFWHHLYMADLFGGIKAESQIMAWGEAFPATKIKKGGGFHIQYHSTAEPPAYFKELPGPYIQGVHLVLSDNPDGDFTHAGKRTYTPQHAALLDRRIDDGKPYSGIMQASGANECFTVTDNIIEYNERLKEPCISYIFIQIEY